MNFEVVRIEPVELEGPAELLEKNLMSPFAWRVDAEDDDDESKGELRVMVRAVPPDKTKGEESGRIWYGKGDPDGLIFRMQNQALITPGPSAEDIKGCEDPTVVQEADGCIVYYTGVEDDGNGHLCYVKGDGIENLTKHGIAHESTKTEKNTKEATVLRNDDDTWRLLFEYAQDGQSKIGLGFSDGPEGPWSEKPDPFSARPEKWDRYHLSTGPLLRTNPERPVMFYNGADKDADWQIGWVALSKDLGEEVERCDGPVIAKPAESDGSRDISFAASLVTKGDEIWLYFSKNDEKLFRATLKQV